MKSTSVLIARNAFVFYSYDARPKLKYQFPDISPLETFQRIQEGWYRLSEDDRSRFYEMARQDKVRAEKDMAKWIDSKK